MQVPENFPLGSIRDITRFATMKGRTSCGQLYVFSGTNLLKEKSGVQAKLEFGPDDDCDVSEMTTASLTTPVSLTMS